jgi:hypothetical protein
VEEAAGRHERHSPEPGPSGSNGIHVRAGEDRHESRNEGE